MTLDSNSITPVLALYTPDPARHQRLMARHVRWRQLFAVVRDLHPRQAAAGRRPD